MHAYEVGQLYHPSLRSWPETPQYNYRSGEHELVLFLASPSLREVEDVREGEAYQRPDGPGGTATIGGLTLGGAEMADLKRRVANIVRDPEASWSYGER